MRIDNLRDTRNEGRRGVAADLSWEDCDREPFTVFFETDAAFADDLTCNPNAFLVGLLPIAMHFGEKRVSMNHEVCPELFEGLVNAMQWIRRWYYSPTKTLVRIETPINKKIAYPKTTDRAGFFFSGGIDAFATFYGNRKRFPLDHPYAIRDGLLVYGLEIDDPTAFSHVWENLKEAGDALGIDLIPVYTNLYLKFRQEDAMNRFAFWSNELMGAALAAVAHVFAKRLSVVSIASNSDVAHLEPNGSHPLLDTNYSSCDLKIRHDNTYRSRFEKTRLISDHDVPLRFLRVCNLSRKYTRRNLNCGVCPKCVKTKLTLLALGALDRTLAFEDKRIDPELVIRGASIYDAYTEATYMDLLEALNERGHHKLAQAVHFRLQQYRFGGTFTGRAIAHLDKRVLNGAYRKMIANRKVKAIAHS